MEKLYDFDLYKYEHLEKHEGQLTIKLLETLRNVVMAEYRSGVTTRDFHSKGHCMVKASFVVEENLDEELRVGIFKNPRTYEAWVRLSNSNVKPRRDWKKDVRAMAVKLVGVEGEKFFDVPEGSNTMDIITMGVPVFLTPNVKQFLDLEVATLKGNRALAWYVLTHPRVTKTLFNSFTRCANLLEIPYWSTTPYLFGPDHAVKYHFRPQSNVMSELPKHPSPNYLREKVIEQLGREEVHYDFMVQFQKDPEKMPIENANVIWKEELSPFRKVATLIFHKQEVNTPERMAFTENSSFNPWRTLHEHRPLGSVNRIRHKVYQGIAAFRHYRNNVPLVEPQENHLPDSSLA